ncbi:unnamed protein product [Orchesella dallaii]|uniref:Uncharacterized protein n=1 Tax=Orchesella dallaii TaxID=48710 RepID=A0ABP1RXG3_9HEXA
MGHGGENTVCSPKNQSNHYPQVGGPHSKKPNSLTKANTNISSGGICHNHDNSKATFSSSKMTKKLHSHSTPQPHSKPINMGKARQSPGKIDYPTPPKGNKTNLVALQQFQQHQIPFHWLKQQSLTANKGQLNAAAPRQKSFSPPTLHPMPSLGEAKPRTASPVMPGSKPKEHFYAGARFETHPSHLGLPVPPSHWTAPLQRSQSQPSSPVPTSLPQKGFSVDLATLFGHSESSFKSASFPGERLMDALVKEESDRKMKQKDNVSIEGKVIGSLALAQVTNNYEKSNDETDELKKALGLGTFTSPVIAASRMSTTGGCRPYGSDMSPTTKYQDISDQLKTLLKVAA